MRTIVAMGLAISFVFGVDAIKADDSLQGTWRLVAGEMNGTPLSEKQLKDGKLVIEEDRYSVTLDGGEAIMGTQTLDPTKQVKTIDIADTCGANKDRSCLGIYEVKGDEFRVSFAPPGKARPSNFSTRPDSGYWTHLWKRVQK